MGRLSERVARPDFRQVRRPDFLATPPRLVGDGTTSGQELTLSLFGELCLFAATASLDGRVTQCGFDARRRSAELADGHLGTPLHAVDWWGPGQAERNQTIEAVRRASDGETVIQERSVDGADGTARTAEFKIAPIGRDGTLSGLACTVVDVTERVRARERDAVLTRELTHRIKNMIAQAQGLASLSMRGGPEVMAACEAFTERLRALSKAQELLTDGLDGGILVSSLVDQVLSPFGLDTERFEVRADGDVTLPEAKGVLLCLALGELGTNALKHGALSNGDGRVALSWSVDGAMPNPSLVLSWRERGGPPVTTPSDGTGRRGFGSTLLGSVLGSARGEECDLRFEPEGVSFRLVLNLPA